MISISVSGEKISHATKKTISSLVNCNFAASLNFEAGSQTIKLWKHLLSKIIKIYAPQYLVSKYHGIFEFAISQFAAASHFSFLRCHECGLQSTRNDGKVNILIC